MTAGPALGAPVLEQAYRRLISVLPRGYRRTHGAEMLGVFLDAASPGAKEPTARDRIDIARLAARVWWRELFLPDRAERRSALLMLSLALPVAVSYGLGLVGRDLWVGLSNGTRTYHAHGLGAAVAHVMQGSGQRHADWASWLAWSVAIVLVLAGRTRWARLPALVGTAAMAVFWTARMLDDYQRTAATSLGWLVLQVAALTVIVVGTRRRAPVMPTGQARALAAAAVLVTVLWPVSHRENPLGPADLQWQMLWLVGAAAVMLATRAGRCALPYLALLLLPFLGPRLLLPPLLMNWADGRPSLQDLPLAEMTVCLVAMMLVVPLGKAIVRALSQVAAHVVGGTG